MKFCEKLRSAKLEIGEILSGMSSKTCCFTGHRSQKLPWGFNEKNTRCMVMKEKVRAEIINAIDCGYEIFISGMAIGFDMICAEIVLELKKMYKNIKLVCAIPCKGQENLWKQDTQERYRKIVKQADKVRCVYDGYIDGCMQERNKYMINNSTLVIALFNGGAGGTMQTINYAKNLDKKIIIIEP